MAPEAKIFVPRNTKGDDLQWAIDGIGGRVLEFEESASIEAYNICPFSLALFFRDCEPDLPIDSESEYVEIFRELRLLPAAKQRNLLVAFFTEGVRSFPNGETLGETMAEIINISLLQPTKEPNPSLLQKLFNEHLFRLNSLPIPLRIIENDWFAAKEAVGCVRRNEAIFAVETVMRDVVRKAERSTVAAKARIMTRSAAEVTISEAVRNEGRNVEWEAASDIIRRCGHDFVGIANWVTVMDLMPQRGYDKGNPFESLIKIYKLGCCPIGVVNHEFVIFVPPVQQPA